MRWAAVIVFSRLPRTLSFVPRYFFHFSDGQRRFSDATGQDLTGIAAARRHAVAQVRELKVAMCHPGIQDLSEWTMIVTDANDKTVFEIGFDSRTFANRTPLLDRERDGDRPVNPTRSDR